MPYSSRRAASGSIRDARLAVEDGTGQHQGSRIIGLVSNRNDLTSRDEINTAGKPIRTISREITFAKLFTSFAVLALLTACVGLYGTMSYSVARQVGEIGIRMALGAQRGAVLWMVLRCVLLLAAVGLAIRFPQPVQSRL